MTANGRLLLDYPAIGIALADGATPARARRRAPPGHGQKRYTGRRLLGSEAAQRRAEPLAAMACRRFRLAAPAVTSGNVRAASGEWMGAHGLPPLVVEFVRACRRDPGLAS